MSGGNHDEKNGNDLVVDFCRNRLVLADSLRVSPNEVVGRSTPDFSEMRLNLLELYTWSGRTEIPVLDIVLVIFHFDV